MKKRSVVFFCVLLGIMFMALLVTGGCAKKQVQAPTAEVTETASEDAQAQAALQTAQKAAAESMTEGQAKPAAEAAARPVEAAGEAKAAAAEKAAEKADEKAAEKAEFRDINFDFDKATLRADARAILKEHAAWLKRNTAARLLIEGHCDERGTSEYNLALGERRAAAAMKYLVELGVAKDRIKTVSYGKERPLDPGHNEEAWAKNRRCHFVLSD